MTAGIAVNKTHREGGAYAPPDFMDYGSLKDEALAGLVAKQDQKAFKELFERYSKRIYNLSYSYVQNRDSAEDIAQEVFITVFRKISGFKSASSFSTWIYRITVNSSISFLRKHRRDEKLTDLELAEDVKSDENEHDADENPEERERTGLRLLQALPENQRTAFILSQRESMKYRDIAGVMKISEKAVESLVYRARENLRKGIRELKVGESE